MTARRMLSQVLEYTGDPSLTRFGVAKDEIVAKLNQQPLIDSAAANGASQTPNVTSDGITFASGQTRDIPHGLGRPPVGFVVTDATLSAPLLVRDNTRPLDEQRVQIRLTHGGAGTTNVKILVL